MHTPHMPHIMIFPGVDIFLFLELEWSWLNFVVTWLKIFKPNDSTKKLSQMVLSQVTGNQIGRYFDNKEQERAKTGVRRHDRSRRARKSLKQTLFEVLTPVFIDFSIMLPDVAETGKMSLFG